MSTRSANGVPRRGGGPPALPSEIRVLGTTWSVEIDPDLEAEEQSSGMTEGRHRRLSFAPTADQPTDFLHELIHALEHSLGFELRHREVKAVARGLAAVLADNPEILDYLERTSR